MGTARQINDLKESFTEISNNNLENEEFELLDDARLDALINRKLEEAQESLYGGGKRMTFDEVDKIIEKTGKLKCLFY